MAIIKSEGRGADKADRGGSRGGDRDGGGRGGDRDGGGFGDKDGDRGGRGGGFHRKKVCRFCSDQDFIMDYKDQRMMQSFVTEHGKIVPRRISGNCAKHQRQLTTDVKRARNLALVGFVSSGADYR
jgi:small subunit ribosomal protein S18